MSHIINSSPLFAKLTTILNSQDESQLQEAYTKLIDRLNFRSLSLMGLPIHIEKKEIIDVLNKSQMVLEDCPVTKRQLSLFSKGKYDSLERALKAATTGELADYAAFFLLLDHLMRLSNGSFSFAYNAMFLATKKRSQLPLKCYGNIFSYVKVLTVEKFVFYALNRVKRGKPIFAYLGNAITTINISEAIISDLFSARFRSSYVGLKLLMQEFLPRLKHKAKWIVDKQLFLVPIKSSNWVDRYLSWNLCFVLSYSRWPLLAMKLVTPKVLDTVNSPDHFIYMRGLSLYFTSICYGVTGFNAEYELADWRDENLYHKLSRANIKEF